MINVYYNYVCILHYLHVFVKWHPDLWYSCKWREWPLQQNLFFLRPLSLQIRTGFNSVAYPKGENNQYPSEYFETNPRKAGIAKSGP